MITINGKLLKKLDITAGISKLNRDWRQQLFIIEQDNDFKDELCCSLFNDKISLLEPYNEGDWIVLTVKLRSREYNGKFYHDIIVVHIESLIEDTNEDQIF
jgi:hypothetical protein